MSVSQQQRGPAWRSILIVLATICCAVILPFLAFGDAAETWIANLFDGALQPTLVAGLVILCLALDAPLPIPSSLVALAAGAMLGLPAGAAIVFVGLTLGNAIGYGLGYYIGQPALSRFGNPSHLASGNKALGPSLLIITRAIPVLSETATIAAGVYAMPLRRFIPPILLANAGLAVLFSWAGAQSVAEQGFLIAFAASICIPLFGYVLWSATRNRRRRNIQT